MIYIYGISHSCFFFSYARHSIMPMSLSLSFFFVNTSICNLLYCGQNEYVCVEFILYSLSLCPRRTSNINIFAFLFVVGALAIQITCICIYFIFSARGIYQSDFMFVYLYMRDLFLVLMYLLKWIRSEQFKQEREWWTVCIGKEIGFRSLAGQRPQSRFGNCSLAAR